MYKEIAPFKMVASTLPFYQRAISFCDFKEDLGGRVSAESSGEDGTIAEKRQRSPCSPDFYR
ncbi:hypothetical protein PaeBR_04595 [Paenibacillus sp. BR2-3]|uniref:hypothetical protein n=1 Tax=Paenibacillus sp. BR2-3 TaxID=3048494 RepID=UPI003977A57E